MPRLLALALPLMSILVVAGLAWGVLGGREEGGPDPDPASTSDPTPVDASPSHFFTEDLREPGDVCQEPLSRPAPGEPVRFADLYTQQRLVAGLYLVGGEDVSEDAFDVAEETVRDMFGDSQLVEPLVAEGAYVIIAAADQEVLDLPEFECLAGARGSEFYDSACGVADRADYPVVTVNELDLVGDRRGPCRGHNILYHELGHLVHGWAIGPADYIDIRIFYQDARGNRAYRGEYALRNTNEYFAEVTQAYFLSIDRAGRKDRGWLESHDPEMYELLAGLYGE